MAGGKAYYVQRVKKHVLQVSDFSTLVTANTNNDYVVIPLTNLSGIIAQVTDKDYNTIVENFKNEISSFGADVVGNVDVWATSTTSLLLYVAKGTYASLAEAQADLAGTVVYYQLATPIETEVATIGNAIAYPNGTVLVDDATIVMTQYGTNAQVDNTSYPIESLDEIYKLNDDGSKTKLDNANATIAGDGLSFTHTDLTSGDMLIFSYFYQGTNIKGLTTVYYYDDRLIVADTTTGTVYKIIFTIDNGVITVDKVAV